MWPKTIRFTLNIMRSFGAKVDVEIGLGPTPKADSVRSRGITWSMTAPPIACPSVGRPSWVPEHLDIIWIDALMSSMRTTLTIDPDNAERLRKLAHRSRLPFKRVLNDA